MESNHLSSGYEPNEIPFLYPAVELCFGELGFEPRQTASKAVVLPLDDSPVAINPKKISKKDCVESV